MRPHDKPPQVRYRLTQKAKDYFPLMHRSWRMLVAVCNGKRTYKDLRKALPKTLHKHLEINLFALACDGFLEVVCG